MNELESAATRLRTEAHRVADVRARLSAAKRDRIWSGPASERFAHSMDRRLRELDEQHELMQLIARRLDDAATTVHHAGSHA
jgi:uncharacterized protein YukE